MNILGISAYYHDSAAALVRDGQLVAAAQEERFTRKRHDESLPVNAVAYCLREAGLRIDDIRYIAFYDKPFLKFERLLFTYLACFPHGFRSFLAAVPMWASQKLWLKSLIRQELNFHGEICFSDHHMSHAASAFLVSPFERAAILTVDGVGEWSTSTWGTGDGTQVHLTHETRFPHSLGLLYSAFTYYLGFKVNSAEYKVMGLAPYGKPVFYDNVCETIDWKPDGSFRLNLKYFDFMAGIRMTSAHMDELFGGPARQPESRLTQREFDIAASVQRVTDEIMLAMASHVRRETGMTKLCLAGGVALNCVANAEVLRKAGFDDLWIQPAAGDAGGAIGAAFYLWNSVLKNGRKYTMQHVYLGPEFSADEIRDYLNSAGAVYVEKSKEHLVHEVAGLLEKGKVIGWHQGRMEFGPRALGARSILADPRDPGMKDKLNRAIKFREGFRPFAPSVTIEAANDWFELNINGSVHDSPYMLLVADVREGRRQIPSVTHVDNSARLQTVTRETSPLYHALIEEFGCRTGVPVLINTSFNVRGEPIVCTPEDAYRCFMRTNMDALALGPFLLRKEEQPAWTEQSSTQLGLD
ncbi:MAG: carbamoyltransferase family protein [Candidatus Sumerlaeaceae bacterium]